MNTDTDIRLNSLTEKIIGCAFEISNTLGCGFLEKPYENAMVHLLKKASLSVQQQVPIKIRFDGVIVGEYVADLVVENAVLVEIKAVKALDDVHAAQCINYLKATGIPLCLLINFGRPRVEHRRYARTPSS
jgi:GxxExxY protein